MKLKELIESAGVEVKEIRGAYDIEVGEMTLDSRQAGKGVMFVCQAGTKSDGHEYASAAAAKGCDIILAERRVDVDDTKVTTVIVTDTHVALGRVASALYGHPSRKMKVVGVTGTNGKTTTATLLYKLMMALGHKAGLFSTVANYVGEERQEAKQTTPDAITIQREMGRMVAAGCKYCFMEVSSHSVVQERISGIEFAGGVFSNLTHDHLDFHKTFAAYREAKKGFFDRLDKGAFALVNIDDKNGEVMIQNTAAKKCRYSLLTAADYKGKVVEDTMEGMLIDVNGREAQMQFVGRFNAYNLLAIYGAAVELGFSPEEVLRVLSGLRPVDGRFETHKTSKGATAIVDYAHTPDALLNVISTINEIRKGSQKLIVVCGCGGDRDRTKRPEMAREAAKGADTVILTSDNPRSEEPEAILDEMKQGLDEDR